MVKLFGGIAATTSLLVFFLSIGNPASAQWYQSGWLTDPDTGCRAWVTGYWKEQADQIDWSGACENGVASGEGTLHYLASSGNQVGAPLTGVFQSGVFVKETKVPFAFEPLASDQVRVFLGEDQETGAKLQLIKRVDRDAAFRLCSTTSADAYAILPLGFDASRNAAVKDLMRRLVGTVARKCNNRLRLTLFVVPNDADLRTSRKDGSVLRPLIAQTSVGNHYPGDEVELGFYQNHEAREAKEKARQAAFAADREAEDREATEKIRASQARLKAFSTAHDVEVWVQLGQLYQNSYRYEGKVIGVRIGLGRFVGKDLVRVWDADRGQAYMMVKGMPPDFLGGIRQRAVLAVRVDPLGDYDLPENFPYHRKDLPAGTFIAGEVCEQYTCSDYFHGIGYDKLGLWEGFDWNEDQSAFIESIPDD